MIEINEDFESLIICAERYACGRRTYMPGIVIGYIIPLISQLSYKALGVICNDIDIASNRGGLGDVSIDAPLWIGLQERIVEELKRRKNE
jgi:hypothetical protein